MDGMTAQLEEILKESLDQIENRTERACAEVAAESVAKLRATSPKNTGQYAAGWTTKPYTEGATKGYVVYNATDYQLTHLLEHGHAKSNGRGRVRARKHIEPVEAQGMRELLEKIKHVAE